MKEIFIITMLVFFLLQTPVMCTSVVISLKWIIHTSTMFFTMSSLMWRQILNREVSISATEMQVYYDLLNMTISKLYSEIVHASGFAWEAEMKSGFWGRNIWAVSSLILVATFGRTFSPNRCHLQDRPFSFDLEPAIRWERNDYAKK